MGNRTDLRHKVKNPYNQQRSTDQQQRLQNKDRCRHDTYLAEHQRRCYQCHQRSGCVECRGVVEYTCHGQSGSNVCRAEDHVALSSTSSLCNCVSISLDLEDQTLELLNRPTTVGVNVEVESTSVSNVCLSTRTSAVL